MFYIFPPEVTENDPISRLSALLAAIGQELLQNLPHTKLHKAFGTVPILMKHNDELKVGKSFVNGVIVFSPKGINCFLFSGYNSFHFKRVGKCHYGQNKCQIPVRTHPNMSGIALKHHFQRQYGLWGFRSHVQLSMKTISYFPYFSLPVGEFGWNALGTLMCSRAHMFSGRTILAKLSLS